MNELEELIKIIVPSEVQENHAVKANQYILNPFMVGNALSGNGEPQEVFTRYQLDIFYEKKGKLVSKIKALKEVLKDYAVSDFQITYETNALLWRGTATIEIL